MQVINPIVVAIEVKTPTQIKPRIEQGGTGFRRKVKTSTPLQPNKPAQVTSKPNLHKPESTAPPQTSLESGPQIRYTLAPQIRSGHQ